MRKLNALVYSVFVILLTPGWLTAGSVINRATGNLNWNTASTWIQNRTGTVTFTNGSINVTGTGTSFTTELQVGNVLMLQASPGTVRGTIATIVSNTQLTLTGGAAGGGTGTYGRQAVPSSSDDVTIGNPLLASTVTITLNTVSATVNSLALAGGSRSNRLIHSGTNSLTVTGSVTVAQPTSDNRTNEWQINAGTASVGGSLSLGGTNTTTTRISRVTLTTGSLDVSGNLTFNSPASVAGVAVVNMSGGNGQLRIGGNLTLTNGSGTLTPGTSGTVVIDGSGSQTVTGGSSIAFFNFTVDKSAGTATPGSNLTVGGNLSVLTGTLDLSTYSANRTAAGGTIAVSGGATLRIGGTNGFPSNYSTVSLNPASTVEYYGSNQTIATAAYGNLTLDGTGSKTMPASTLTLGGNFLATGTASATAQGSLMVAGNFTIDPGATFDAASFTHEIGGDWSNGGTFTPSTGTMVMNGTAAQSMSGSVFNNLTIDNPSDVTMLTDETVNGILSVVSGRLISGANTVFLGSSAALAESPGATVFGTITTTRNIIATSGTESFGGIGAAITLHGTAPGNTTVTRTTGTAASGNGNNSILRIFDINPAVNSGLFADLSVRYDYTELNGQDAAALELYKSTDNGSSWKNKAGSSDTAAKTINVYGLNGFSDWTAADPSNSLGSPATPSISQISPTLRNIGDGTFTLTVDGTEFVSGKSTVRFAGSGRTTTYVDEHQVTASIPASDQTAPGDFQITVFTTGAGSSNLETLTVAPKIVATASANGSISPVGTVTVAFGTNQSYTFTPNTGYHIDSVVVDGVNQGAVASYDFTNVTANHTIAAYFSINVHTITATASTGGNISPSGAVNVNYGSNQSFSVTPNTGYHIDSVVVDGANQGTVAGYDFTNVT
ncbi:MAG TPA: hypothetical protein VI932_08660, partial [Bacteroidota bacterium]|nr:hypothetical protein [Bacteroidota bacterium]